MLVLSLILVQVYLSFQQQQFDGKFDNVTMNKRLVTNVILSVNVKDEIFCIANCVTHHRCKSTNFNVKTKECELLSTSAKESEALEPSDDWVHFEESVEVEVRLEKVTYDALMKKSLFNYDN